MKSVKDEPHPQITHFRTITKRLTSSKKCKGSFIVDSLHSGDTTVRHVAIYVRVSSRAQDQRSQLPDLKRWIEAYSDGQPVQWYRDAASG
jgi:hypothetical protein